MAGRGWMGRSRGRRAYCPIYECVCVCVIFSYTNIILYFIRGEAAASPGGSEIRQVDVVVYGARGVRRARTHKLTLLRGTLPTRPLNPRLPGPNSDPRPWPPPRFGSDGAPGHEDILPRRPLYTHTHIKHSAGNVYK